MKRYVPIILGVGALGFLVYKIRQQVNLLSDYETEVSDAELTEFSFSKANLRVVLNIKNKSDIKISIDSYKLDAFLNDQYITTISKDKSTVLKPKSTTSITLNIPFKPADVAKEALSRDFLTNVFVDPSKIKAHIQGDISVTSDDLLSFDNIKVNTEFELSEFIAKSGE